LLEHGLTEELGRVGWWGPAGPTREEEADRMAWADLDHLGRLGQNWEFGLGCQKRIEKGFGILATKINLNQDNFEFKSKDIFKVKLQFKLKIKFKTFTNGNLGFVSKIQI
jgi:hypothetical protein